MRAPGQAGEAGATSASRSRARRGVELAGRSWGHGVPAARRRKKEPREQSQQPREDSILRRRPRLGVGRLAPPRGEHLGPRPALLPASAPPPVRRRGQPHQRPQPFTCRRLPGGRARGEGARNGPGRHHPVVSALRREGPPANTARPRGPGTPLPSSRATPLQSGAILRRALRPYRPRPAPGTAGGPLRPASPLSPESPARPAGPCPGCAGTAC